MTVDSFKTTYIGLYLMYKILENTKRTKLKFYTRVNIGLKQTTTWIFKQLQLNTIREIIKMKIILYVTSNM